MGVCSAAHILISIYEVHKPQHDAPHFSLSAWGRTAVRRVPRSANDRGPAVDPRIGNTGVTEDQDEDVTNCIKICRLK